MESTGITEIGVLSVLFISAGTYPLPLARLTSITSVAFSSRVAMCRSGLKISMSESPMISAAVTSLGPTALMITLFVLSPFNLIASF